MENNLAPFYVGQKVVAIKNQSQGLFKKGEIFTVLDNSQCPKCGEWCVDIGLKLPQRSRVHCYCKHTVIKEKGTE